MGARTAALVAGVLVLCVGVLCAPSPEGDVLEIETEMETELLSDSVMELAQAVKGKAAAAKKKKAKVAKKSKKPKKAAKKASKAKKGEDAFATKLREQKKKDASQDDKRLGHEAQTHTAAAERDTITQEREGTYKEEPSPRNLSTATAKEVGKAAADKVYAAAHAVVAKEKALKYAKRKAKEHSAKKKEAAENKARAEKWALQAKAEAHERKEKAAAKIYMKRVIAAEHPKKTKPTAHPERAHKKKKFQSIAKKQLAGAVADMRVKDVANNQKSRASEHQNGPDAAAKAAKTGKKAVGAKAKVVKPPMPKSKDIFEMVQGDRKAVQVEEEDEDEEDGKPIRLLGLWW